MAESDWNIIKLSLSNEAPIDLVVTKRSGRGLVATRRITPNEIIFEETPLTMGPSQKFGNDASIPMEKYLLCAGCSVPLSPISVVGMMVKYKGEI